MLDSVCFSAVRRQGLVFYFGIVYRLSESLRRSVSHFRHFRQPWRQIPHPACSGKRTKQHYLFKTPTISHHCSSESEGQKPAIAPRKMPPPLFLSCVWSRLWLLDRVSYEDPSGGFCQHKINRKLKLFHCCLFSYQRLIRPGRDVCNDVALAHTCPQRQIWRSLPRCDSPFTSLTSRDPPLRDARPLPG